MRHLNRPGFVACTAVLLATLTLIPQMNVMAQEPMRELLTTPSCRVAGSVLVADFSSPVTLGGTNVVFDVHSGESASFSEIIPLRTSQPLLTVRAQPLAAGRLLTSSSSVNCHIESVSWLWAYDDACGVYVPIDSGIEITVQDIELWRGHVYAQVSAKRTVLAGVDLESLTGNSLYVSTGLGRSIRRTAEPLLGPGPVTVDLENSPTQGSPRKLEFGVNNESPIATICF
jgi:hypothetical protein